MGDHVVTLNAGSSSIKFALFANEIGWARMLASGQVEGLGAAPEFEARSGGGEELVKRALA
jgi:acetate kinase